MTYGELIKELFERSGLETIAEYADRVGITRSHMSNILRGEQPGSWKILDHCLADAGRKDALRLEDDEPASKEDAEALRLFRGLDARARGVVLELLRQIPREKKPSRK